jgi:hypothetical protein
MSHITIVSGLPRSGTSLMMQMLDAGGIPAVTDEIREADTDNPRGYYEFERVKQTKKDATWLPSARGKAVKMVSPLLYDLPATEQYRVIFMQRDLDEVLASQEKMLARLGRPAAPRDQMKKSFLTHLEQLFRWLPSQRHMRVLTVSYNELMLDSDGVLRQVVDFLDGVPALDRMLGSIDQNLYRNRMAK